jgi:hypothetical protein
VKVLDHTAHSQDLGPRDLHYVLHLKKHMASQEFHEDKEMKNEVIIWLCAQALTKLVIMLKNR